MVLTAIFFYLFAGLLLLAGLMVISARNPVHAVLFLIFAFFNAAGLFVLLGAEFLAMILMIVYVGAVAVLFLFVVMMLDIDFAELRAGFMEHFWLGAAVGGIALGELLYVVGSWGVKSSTIGTGAAAGVGTTTAPPETSISNTEALGNVLYTKYVFFFEVAGLVLLVALIGAIVLTLHQKAGVKRQSIAAQVARNPQSAVEVIKVASGQAVFPSTKPEAGE